LKGGAAQKVAVRGGGFEGLRTNGAGRRRCITETRRSEPV
jgi:hypothetical protein